MSEPVYFLRLELENIRCFGEKATLDLSDGKGNWKKWTVILGDNGTGKTTILQCLVGMENDDSNNKYLDIPEDKYAGPNMFNYLVKQGIEIRRTGRELGARASVYLKTGKNNGANYQADIYFEHASNGLFVTRGHDSYDFPPFCCFGYGANRIMSLKSNKESHSENSESLFDDNARLINAEEWLLQLDFLAGKDFGDISDFAAKRSQKVKSILIDLLPDVDSIRYSIPTKENLKSFIEFKTPYGWVTIHQLSLGYKTMVSWMVDLAARMFERYPDSDNPLTEPAIVLVDEIDLHMHPKWQQKIFDYLSDKFPQTQFIVTAHSPLIVQSAPKDANIVLLRKEGDHVVIDNDIKSVQNWRLDQIMSSDLFGISARSPEVEKWLRERTMLLQKEGELTEVEKQRLKELNEKTYNLPTADTEEDIEAMKIIREAAEYLRGQTA